MKNRERQDATLPGVLEGVCERCCCIKNKNELMAVDSDTTRYILWLCPECFAREWKQCPDCGVEGIIGEQGCGCGY